MSSLISFPHENLDWRKAYLAAVLEKDRQRLPALIRRARETCSERLLTLSKSGPVPSDEVNAIHDALYMLQALLGSISYRTEAGEWTRSDLDN